MTTDAEIFAAIRARKGAGLTQDEVNTINAIMYPSGVGRKLANEEAFFVGVRKITGALDQVQVDVINDLLDGASSWGVGWLAYGLATAWHESRLKPIEEWGKGSGKAYGKVDQTGKAPYGRGLAQLTWRDNYVNADNKLSLGGKLAADYDLALDPEIASKILIGGMAAGWFTGKSLGTYLAKDAAGNSAVFKEMRRIINGTDKADLIAGYAVKFQDALLGGGWK